MNHGIDKDDSLSWELEALIDERCDSFEDALKARRQPALEQFLQPLPPAGGDVLFRDLLRLELHYRRQGGERPAREDYLPRFPAYAGIIEEMLPVSPPEQETTRSGATARASVFNVSIPGLEVLGELGRGGMGVVLRGRDTELGREIAVKALLEKHQGEAGLIKRFVEEAQIAGQLQHPGITPVYEMGGRDDNRPYFTMKLVKGQTLAKLLAQRSDPGQDRPRFLKVFEQVCQTLAYAHAHNVIHRDLKPANIMVGAFGEVQVMDWGLAKVLDPRREEKTEPEEAISVIATVRSSSDDGSEDTRAGSVMGTPAYMAPEQARGEVERVDERADVFGLGALLCEILTGKPPFAGKPAEAMRQALKGDLSDAEGRLDRCGADAELVRLTRNCLAAEPADRPANAGILAAEMTAYLESVQERLRQAEVARAAEQARAEEARATAAAAEAKVRAERRARRMTAALAASVLISGLLGGGGFVWVQQQRIEQRSARARAIEEALEKAAELRGRAAAAPVGEVSGWGVALAVLGRAEDLLAQGEADATLRERVAAVRENLERGREQAQQRADDAAAERRLVARLEAIRGERGEYFDAKRADRDYADAFRAFGLDLDVVEPKEAGAKLAGRLATAEIAAALDEWCSLRRIDLARAKDVRPWQRLVAVARVADPDPWRNGLRAAFGRPRTEARAALCKQAEDAALQRQPAASLVLLADMLKRAGEADRSVAVLRTAWGRFPSEFWVNFNLGMSSWKDGRYERPEEAVRFLTAAVGARPSSPAALNNLGNALVKQGKLDEAAAAFTRAVQFDPKHLQALINRGNCLSDQGKLDEAVAAFHQALQVDPKFAPAYCNLGTALNMQGKRDEAIAAYRQAIKLDPTFALAHGGLGAALLRQGKVDEGIAASRQAIKLDPKLAPVHNNLGIALKEKGQLDEAIAAFRQAIKLDPKLAPVHNNLRRLLLAQGRLAEASRAWADALRQEPADHNAWYGHAELCLFLGDEAAYHQACARLLARFASTTDPNVAERTARACLLLAKPDDLDRAAALADRAAAVSKHPRHISFQAVHGLAEYRRGRHASAVALLQPVAGRLPPMARLVLAMSLHRLGKKPEALQTLRLALASFNWDEKKARDADAWISHVLRQEAEELLLPGLTDLLQGKPLPMNAPLLDLAGACAYRERFAVAARLYSDAFAADAKKADDLRAGYRYQAACAAALAGCGRGKDAAKLEEKERIRLREQALAWLKADLAARRKQLGSDKPGDSAAARQALSHWQKDADLAGLRDKDAVAKLPAEEQKACRTFWADVETLLRQDQQEK